ncbi:MAG: histidine phosphatase family protein [Propionibacteriaceae bacterium]|jgi:probable phosphoglycerate mutase|nr:histidine phosphatase family protein [Propionibacteriaceae bacterium]
MSVKSFPQATRLILWRHGVTDWNAAGRFQGQTDIELNADGLRQAEASAPYVAALHPTAIYASPLKRAAVTAAAASKVLGLPIEYRSDLMEINVGSWSGLSVTDARELDPAFALAQDTGHDYRRSATGETFVEAGERAAAELRRIAAAHSGETVLVAGHGGTTRMSLGLLLGWDFRTTMALSGITNCAWSVVTQREPGGAWRLDSFNVSVVAGAVGPSGLV